MELEAREDSQAPKAMWGLPGQRVPQGLQGPQGLRENQESLGSRVRQVNGGPWGLRVNQGFRVPLASPVPRAHQEARAITEEGPGPRHCYRMPGSGLWAQPAPRRLYLQTVVVL